MEDLGTYYAILLHDPELRQVLVDQSQPTRPSRIPTSRLGSVRIRLAQTLVALAGRIEPSPPGWNAASPREAAVGQ